MGLTNAWPEKAIWPTSICFFFKQIMKSSIYVFQCWQEHTESISGMRHTLLIGKGHPLRPTHKQKDNIQVDLMQKGVEEWCRFTLTVDTVQWEALMYLILTFTFLYYDV